MKTDNNLSVLIVEDEEIFSDLAYQVFEGYHRYIANSAIEGLEKYEKLCPDIVMLDIGLPDMSGLELLAKIKEYDPEAFVVMLTKSRIAHDVSEAKKHGAAGYILKPFSYNKVRDCIEKYKEYKTKLNELSPDERADNLIRNLHIEALDKDLILQQSQDKKLSEHQRAVNEAIRNWSILFVDDYPTNREKAGKQLQKLGCSVELAASGEIALQKLNRKEYDFILLDSNMNPGMSGYDTAKKIREIENEKNLKKSIIVAMVDYTDEIEKKLWINAQMDDYIKKPTRFFDLRQKIEKYINLILEKTNGQ